MSDPADPQSWVEKAEEDYQLMRTSLHRKHPIIYGVTFHAQQCVEKYLKGILVQQGEAPTRSHDLNILANLCEQSGIILPVDEDTLSLLTKYATKFRYPGDDSTIDEAKQAATTAETVRKYARKLLISRT